MKKTYLAKRNALLAIANYSWGAIALLFALLTLIVRLMAPNIFWSITSPVFRAADSIANVQHALISSFREKVGLVTANEQLMLQNDALENENRALMKKASSLSSLLGADGSSSARGAGILGEVVARPPESPYDTLVLAQGSNAGVSKGMEIFGPGGVPLGVVEAVTSDFSQAVLFSAHGMSVDGWVGEKNLAVTVLGTGGGVMTASLSRSAEVVIGDTVFVPGPGMLPVGVVTRIDSDASSPSVTLRITPALNLFSIGFVTIRATGIMNSTSFFAATSTRP